ncbi:MEDS domain-containing protein [Nakamurella sp. GG22]
MPGDPVGAPARRHSYAVVDGPEHTREVSSAFITAGLTRSERVTLIGVTDRQTGPLLTRLREDGADPHTALRDGQLIIADRSATAAVYTMTAQQLTDQVRQLATAAAGDGYTGIRLAGLLPGLTTSPHEATLSRLVREHPVTALCLYHPQAPAEVLSQARTLHDRRVPSTAVFNDPDVRVSTLPRHGLRLAGRIHPGNRAAVLAVLARTARNGPLIVDVASLRDIDTGSLHTILNSGLRLSLRRPNPRVQRLTQELTAEMNPGSPGNTMARSAFPVPGQTAAAVVTNLTWRTYGPAQAGRAESVLDWAGLHGEPAGPIAEVAHRHHTTPATLTNRIRRVTNRGAQTPLSPLLLRDVTRPTQPTEDHLSRLRTAQLLGLPPPRPQ